MNEIDRCVGQRIRARRVALGMSQTDLGNAIGVRFQQVQKYEAGTNRVSASRLWAIGEVLRVHVSHFFEDIQTGDDSDESAASASQKRDFFADREAIEMIEVFADLPPAQKRAVLDLVKNMSAGANA